MRVSAALLGFGCAVALGIGKMPSPPAIVAAVAVAALLRSSRRLRRPSSHPSQSGQMIRFVLALSIGISCRCCSIRCCSICMARLPWIGKHCFVYFVESLEFDNLSFEELLAIAFAIDFRSLLDAAE